MLLYRLCICSANLQYSLCLRFTMEVLMLLMCTALRSVIGILQTAPKAPEFYQGGEAKSTVHPQGSTLRMRCAVNSNPPAVVTWFQSGDEIVDMKPKVRLRSGSNYNVLIIKDLEVTDSGDYVCTATNRYGRITKTYSISVVETRHLRPTAIFVEPATLSLRCGGTAEFRCRYHSEIPIHVQWLLEVSTNDSSRYESKSIVSVKSKSYEVLPNSASEDDVLRIPNVTSDHNGRLVCMVANRFGYAYSGASVHVSPQLGLPTFDKELEDTRVENSAPHFTLDCVVRVPANLGYHVTWAKEGEPVDPEVYVFKEVNHTNELDLCVEEITSRITFSPLVKGHWLAAKDGGLYSCLVQNKSGSTVLYDQATVTIDQPVPPSHRDSGGLDRDATVVSLIPIRATVHEGDTVTFYCQVKGHSPTVVWLVKPDATLPVCDYRHTLQIDYIPYRLIGPGEMWSRDEGERLSILRIENITMEHTGTYLCYVVESSARLETTLTILPGSSGPEVLPPFLGNRTAFVGDNVVLQCRARSDVTPTVQWYKEVEESYSDGETSSIAGVRVTSLGASESVWESNGAYVSAHTFPDGVQIADQGRYLCAWSTQWGEDLDQGYLRVRQCELGQKGNNVAGNVQLAR